MNKLVTLLKGLIGLCLFLPLLTIPSHFVYPSLVPKVIIFRIIIEIMIVFWVWLLLREPNRLIKLATPIAYSVLFYLASSAISTVAGVDWHRSFWDLPDRMLGLFNLIHYVVFFFIVATTIRSWKTWRILFLIFLSISAIIAVIAIAQKINPYFFYNQGEERISSTLGNPSYLAGYCMVTVFISIILYVKKKGMLYRCFILAGGMLNITVLLLAETRGTLVAFVVGFGVLISCYTLTSAKRVGIRWCLVIAVVATILIAGLLSFAFRNSAYIQNIPTLRRLSNISFSEGVAGTTRIKYARIAIEAIKDHPLLGWGPNNYYYAFNKYCNLELWSHHEVWVDSAHNFALNIFAEQGIIGIISYFLLNFIPIFSLWRGHIKGHLNRHIPCIGTALIASHFIHNSFLFETPVSYLYSMLILAFLNSQIYRQTVIEIKRTDHPALSFIPRVAVTVMSALLIWFTNIKEAQANMALFDTRRFVSEFEATSALTAFDSYLRLFSVHKSHARNKLGSLVVAKATDYFTIGKESDLKSLLTKIYDEIEKSKDQHPLDLSSLIMRGQIANLLAELFDDNKRCFQVEKELEYGLTLSPKRHAILFILSAIKMKLEKPYEAIRCLQIAIEHTPEVGTAWCHLAILYNDLGHSETARQLVRMAITNKVPL